VAVQSVATSTPKPVAATPPALRQPTPTATAREANVTEGKISHWIIQPTANQQPKDRFSDPKSADDPLVAFWPGPVLTMSLYRFPYVLGPLRAK